MKYIETRTLSASSLRKLCIEKNWYTCGDNDDYENLFNKLYDCIGNEENLTTEKLAEIATDIFDHSDINEYEVEDIMFLLAEVCAVTFEKADS